MRFMRSLVLSGALSLSFCGLALAQSETDNTQPVISKRWHADYRVDQDGRHDETIAMELGVVQESGIDQVKTYSFSFSTSIQTGEVLEAYTLKKDGRKLMVPADNYQTQINDGRRGARPMFSDRTRISVVFPEVAVGDTVGLRYRIVNKEAMFPGHFSMALSFSPFAVYEDVQVRIDAPRDLKLGVETHGMQAAESASGDRRVLQWRYQNLKSRAWSEADAGIWRHDESPGLLVSTFASYEAIAQAYGARALPKAEPTQRIRELSREVLGDEKRPREMARKLYEWVSKNITYGGNCIGIGAVVPRDLDVVLDNKMGDCKDHATLLQALLNAAGIPSEQVLVNASELYDLPSTPVVSLVNHVMTYFPGFDLYADATAKEIPFGHLPMGLYAKPVIHVGAAKALARIPNQDHRSNVQRVRMSIKVAETGRATGEMQVSLKGVEAAGVRSYMRQLNGDAERQFTRRALSSYGYKGQGTVNKGETAGLSDEYAFSITFEIENYLDGGASGAFVLGPVIGTPMPVMNFAGVRQEDPIKRRHTCHGFHSYETLDIQLAPGVTLLSLPSDSRVRSRLIDYTARFQKTRTGVLVTREVHDKTPESVCPPELTAELYRHALPVADNLKTQVLYKRKVR
jgi:transglutaminase-like putative cysteine protease